MSCFDKGSRILAAIEDVPGVIPALSLGDPHEPAATQALGEVVATLARIGGQLVARSL